MQLGTDGRAQSVQIGAVLLFAIIIILLSLWQAVIVPNQNSDVEFDHYQTAERDMIELRSEILRAKTTGSDAFATVQLGTEFSNRVVTRNPPDPTGSIRTSENKTLRVVDSSGNELNLIESGENRFVEYQPNYAEYQEASRIRYENTVVYSEFGSNNIFLSNQRLLRGDRVSLIPLHQEFQASGKQTVPIEPIPGILEREEVQDPTVTVGTALNEEDWEELLEEEIAENDDLDTGDIVVSDGNLTLTLDGTYSIEYAPVGLDRPPSGGERGDDSTEINPAAPGDIRLETEYRNGSNSEVKLVFNNTAETNNFTEGRIAFYNSEEGGNNEPTRANITEGDTAAGTETTLNFRDSLEVLNDKIILDGDAETTVTLNFSSGDNDSPNLDSNSWFVLELLLESGEKATYFTPIPDKNSSP